MSALSEIRASKQRNCADRAGTATVYCDDRAASHPSNARACDDTYCRVSAAAGVRRSSEASNISAALLLASTARSSES